MSKLKSEGKCVFCEKTYAKRSITKHLNSHLEKQGEASSEKNKYFHIRVEAAEMFLQLLVADKASLAKLDSFLRGIWLECCGHLSSFGYRDSSGYGRFVEIEMDTNIGQAFKIGKEYQYDYDFGSTTRLVVKILKEFPLDEKKEIVLLSRNEPLEIYCHVCKKEPATDMCTMHYDSDFFFCEKCSEEHEESCEDAEYALVSIVNSPRMGVCGYDGGQIDLERDGVFKKEK